MNAYLDIATGEVIRVTAQIRQELEAIYADVPVPSLGAASRTASRPPAQGLVGDGGASHL
jgi:hypothetical protein